MSRNHFDFFSPTSVQRRSLRIGALGNTHSETAISANVAPDAISELECDRNAKIKISIVESIAALPIERALGNESLSYAIAATVKPKVSKRSLDLLYLQSLKFMDR